MKIHTFISPLFRLTLAGVTFFLIVFILNTVPGYTILRRGISEALEKKGLTDDSTPMNLIPKEEKIEK